MATFTGDLMSQVRQACSATRVPSFTARNKTYVVRDLFTPFVTCECPDFGYRKQREVGDDRLCKHIVWGREGVMAVYAVAVELRRQIEDPLQGLSVVDSKAS